MRNSIFNINVDYEKSHGSYVYDKNTRREYLDFMCMFSSLPLGYNHQIFKDGRFARDVAKVSEMRMTLCEYTTNERERFEFKFNEFATLDGIFNYSHFACTGALAIEHACKMAMQYSFPDGSVKNPVIVSQANSFHGITSYGNFLTDRTPVVATRLKGFPSMDWPRFEHLHELEEILKDVNDVAGIIIEPVQSTNGDLYYHADYFKEIRRLATINNVPLIFDEIQTGFGTTGKLWCFEHTEVVPDIVVFGKKSQVCGVMSTSKLSSFFARPSRMCITWDGDLIDMVRSTYVMEAIERFSLVDNAKNMGEKLRSGLIDLGMLNVRGLGLLVAFDLRSTNERDTFYKRLKEKGMLCNPTGEKSIRLRPNLAVTSEEIDAAIEIIKKTNG